MHPRLVTCMVIFILFALGFASLGNVNTLFCALFTLNKQHLCVRFDQLEQLLNMLVIKADAAI